MSDRIEGIAFSIEGLRRDADEIEACGGGNEAAHMRWAAARIAELEAEVARLRWQPIETAPKDGTLIIGIWFHDYAEPAPRWVFHCCRYVQSGRGGWWQDDWTDGDTVEPTHWRPAPNPPISAE